MPTLRLALFLPANRMHGPIALQEARDDHGRSDLVRISEYIDVAFPPLTTDSKANELHILETQRQEVARKYHAEVDKLDKQVRALNSEQLTSVSRLS